MIAERGDHLRQGGVGVLLSGHRLWQAQHLRADFGLYVVRQSAKLKDDLGDSVNGGVDTREAEASGRGGGKGYAGSSLCVNPGDIRHLSP